MRSTSASTLSALISIVICGASVAGTVTLSPGGLGQVSVQVASFQELKFREVIKQAYDFSCGSAAVATLLTFYYEQARSEETVFRAMFENGDQEKIRRKGFSLLDMKIYLESQGYKADGFRISLDKLVAVDIAAIALVNVAGYSHFVVIKAIDEQRVLLSDPAVGNRIVRREEFAEIWNGIFLVIHSHTEVAKPYFNTAEAWQYLPGAPLGEAISRSTLAQFTMSLSPRPGDY